MNLTIICGSSNPAKRAELWDGISELSMDTSKPWLILGDFNEVRRREERVRPKAKVTPRNLELFNMCLEDSSLNELQAIGEEIS